MLVGEISIWPETIKIAALQSPFDLGFVRNLDQGPVMQIIKLGLDLWLIIAWSFFQLHYVLVKEFMLSKLKWNVLKTCISEICVEWICVNQGVYVYLFSIPRTNPRNSWRIWQHRRSTNRIGARIEIPLATATAFLLLLTLLNFQSVGRGAITFTSGVVHKLRWKDFPHFWPPT
jgi:hypothetical protein